MSLAALDALLEPIAEDGRTFAAYALPPLSRIARELMQARLRKQALVFGLGDGLVVANVDRAGHTVRIDAARMHALNDALSQALLGDPAFRLRLLRRFVHAARRLAGTRRAVEATLDFGTVALPGTLRAYFDATTTFHELGALKFGFPIDPVRERFVALLERDGVDAATAATMLDVARAPAGASLFARLDAVRLRLAAARVAGPADRYRRRLERWAPRFDLLRRDDIASGDDAGAADVLDAEVVEQLRVFGGVEVVRAEIERRAAAVRAREAARAGALRRVHAAIGRHREERLWLLGMLQLNDALVAHEDRNRVAKARFLRAFERTCASLGLPSRETGILEVLAALNAPGRLPPTARSDAASRAWPLPTPRSIGGPPIPVGFSLPPLFTRIEEAAGRALLARDRGRLTSAAAVEERFRARPALLPAHVRGVAVTRVDELTGNLCDLLVRCTFATGDTVVGKVFLPIVKERPALAFHRALASRGRGVDRRMNLFADRLPETAISRDTFHDRTAADATAAVGLTVQATRRSIRVPRAYGYDDDWRVVWMQDAGSSIRPLARQDWPTALPVLAAALAAVHAPGIGPDAARKLRDPLRAAYLIGHAGRTLAPFLDSPRRIRRWRRFLAEDAAARRALIHGDLCPKNVVVDGHGAMWLLDFDRANVASPAYDVGVFAAHLLIEDAADDAAGFVARYVEASGEDEAFAFRVAMHAALTLAYRVETPDFIGVDGTSVRSRITRWIAALLDRREPWRAVAHTH